MSRPETAAGKRLILVELNEVNFVLAEKYVSSLKLRNFERLLQGGVRRTSCEQEYEHFEPWIQWVSAHSGLTASEHGISRLGDIVGSGILQIFERLEAHGLVVGAVSPMNAENRLRQPAYFVPDPWTKTPSDGGFWSRLVTETVAQAVNDNATGRLRARSMFAFALGLLRFAYPRNYRTYLRLALKSIGAPWRRALFLDLFLHDLHYRLFSARRPDFSTVFFNAGAHIQHHYFFNATMAMKSSVKNPAWYVPEHVDPFAEMLQVYDRILGDYLDLPDVDLIVATGLTQKPYDRVKFYWRLKEHAAFLEQLGIGFREVLPRMTRDFLIECDNREQAVLAERVLEQVTAVRDGQRIFGDIDNRGASLFVTLTYPDEMGPGFLVSYPGGQLDLRPHVAFVAIKNGMHDPNGFIFFKGDIGKHAPPDDAHIKSLYGTVMKYFGAHATPALVQGTNETEGCAPLALTASIVVYENPAAQVRQLIDSLRRSGLDMHIYLCDNSRVPGAYDHLIDEGVSYTFTGSNLGFGRAHNLAFKEASPRGAPFHLITNPDIEVKPGALESMVRMMQERPEIALLSPKVLYPDGSLQRLCKRLPTPYDMLVRRFGPVFLRERNNKRYELHQFGYDKVAEIPNLTGAFMLVRADAFKQVGGFDERYFLYMEDIDLCRRIRAIGKTVFYPVAEVIHNHGAGSYDSWKLLVAHIRSSVIYFNKYGWVLDSERTAANRNAVLMLEPLEHAPHQGAAGQPGPPGSGQLKLRSAEQTSRVL